MAHEKEIPEYALQPAKAPTVIPAEAIYHTASIRCPAETRTVTHTFEEDILVPDRDPDLREILLMDAACDVDPGEKKLAPGTDDLVSLTGTVTVQTVYAAEDAGRGLTTILSRIPYQYQWTLEPGIEGDGVFTCSVQEAAYMVVNERKFRVRITLAFSAQILSNQTLPFFAGVEHEALEMRQAQARLCSLELVRKDEVAIDESFPARDAGHRPVAILKQDFAVTENYRQVTKEKVVINGFLHCSVLYSADGGEGGAPEPCQIRRRVEFTQFIPIEKAYRDRDWQTIRIRFFVRDLSVRIVRDEEEPETAQFRVQGSVQSRIELYSRQEQKMVVDAYHREKLFDCDVVRRQITGFVGAGTAEVSVREILNLPEGARLAAAVYADAKVRNWVYRCERGRVLLDGALACSVLWKDEEGLYHTEQAGPAFHGAVELDAVTAGQQAVCRPVVREAWLEYINEKQVEINVSMLLWAEACRSTEITLLEKPRFVERPQGKTYPMVIVTVQPEETLWDLAKRYRTTEAYLRTANHMEEAPKAGEKLLIVK